MRTETFLNTGIHVFHEPSKWWCQSGPYSLWKIALYIHKRMRGCIHRIIVKNTLPSQTPWKGCPGPLQHHLRTTAVLMVSSCVCFLYSGGCLKAESVSYVCLCSWCPSWWTALTSPSLNLPQAHLWLSTTGTTLSTLSSHPDLQDSAQLEEVWVGTSS